MRRLLAVSCVTVALAHSPASAQVAPYRFEALAERPEGPAPFGDGGVRKLPALNNYGTVAYTIPRAGATATDEILYTGTPGNVSEVATPGLRGVGGVSINNPGRVAFVGYAPGGSGYGVYTVTPGGPVVTIAPAVSYSDRYETAISDGGAVITTSDPAFGMPAWVAGSIIMGDGASPAQVVFSGRSPHPQSPSEPPKYFARG